ncbi:hypothetical protein JYT36_00540 [Bacteroidales bacterium AH-315-N07]|nr:hypothetical protein [Bacteroidales bacterium AH-315-N07]
MEPRNKAKGIPKNALIIFKLNNDEEFNKWHEELSLKNREPNQPVYYVKVNKWRNQSNLEKVRITKALA